MTTWKHAGDCCPSCGLEDTYEDDTDDYYLGCRYVCINCGQGFYLHLFDVPEEELKFLRSIYGKTEK